MAINDLAQREQALDPARSFAVSAPAGSGKTELLTRRVLRLLAAVDQPEEILCITFTRKAATEMRSRIIAALERGGDERPPPSAYERATWQLARAALVRDRECQWQLLANPNRLGIQTIDGFCMQLARSLPITAGIGAEPAIAEQPQLLYQQAVRALFASMADNATIRAQLEILIPHFDGNTERIEELLCSILATRDQWLRLFVANSQDMDAFRHYLEAVLVRLTRDTLAAASSLLAPWRQQLLELTRAAACNLRQQGAAAELATLHALQELPATEPEDLPRWRAMTDWLLTGQDQWRKSLTKNNGFPGATKEPQKSEYKQLKAEALALIDELKRQPRLLEALQELRALPPARFNAGQWRLLEALSRLLPSLAAQLLLAFREQGAVDHVQVTSAALEALGHEELPSDRALLLDHRLNHILVDEFQDTSTTQFQLLGRLTENWLPGDGRSLFIVGDGMQSCYGFRDANVGLFLVARQFGIGGAQLENLDLVSNFRSTSGVVGWVNQVFGDAFPAHDDIGHGAVAYRPSVATGMDDAASFPAVAAFACIDDETRQQESAQVTLAAFACIDDETRQQESAQVTLLVQETLAQSSSDNVAILVRNRQHLARIIPALQAADIAWQAVDIDSLAQRPIISDLLALTRALLNPIDDIAWLALLRSPVCGLTLHDLHALMSEPVAPETAAATIWDRINDHRRRDQLSADGRARLERILLTLQPAIAERCRMPLRSWLEHAWLSLGGPNQAYPAADLEQPPRFWDLLEANEQGGDVIDMVDFERRVARLFAKPEDSTSARVHLMTMHKAKGLEFDHVILPGLDRVGRASGNDIMLWYERVAADGDSGLLLSPIAGRGAEPDPLYDFVKREQRIKDRLEETRLLYVACTRAIKRLSLVCCAQHDAGSGEPGAPPARSLLSRIWDTIAPSVQPVEAQIPAQTEPQPVIPLQRLLLADYREASRSPPQAPGPGN